MFIKSNKDLMLAYQIAKRRMNGNLELEVHKKFNKYFAYAMIYLAFMGSCLFSASSYAYWYFFLKPKGIALSLGLIPGATKLAPIFSFVGKKISMLTKAIQGMSFMTIWLMYYCFGLALRFRRSYKYERKKRLESMLISSK